MYHAEADWELGKVVKRWRVNPTGENAHLAPDGTVTFDEDKIIRAQQIFKHNYYRADGPWDLKTRARYRDQGCFQTNGNASVEARCLHGDVQEHPQ
jgi:hypothetical protein